MKFQCPSCREQSLNQNKTADVLICSRCNSEFACKDGIACFVPNTLFTALDEIDYDQHYSVSNESSQQIFSDLKSVLGHRLKDRYRVLVEIGAGTGGFTKGLLSNIRVNDAIVTDISSKMLSQCKKRIFDGPHRAKNITFATYSSMEKIFSANSVDCVIGNFVLHHILDYKGFFKTSYRMLRNGGSVFFSEPGFKFHHALVLSMSDVLETLISDGSVNSDNDITRLANWVHELHFNLKYAGDQEVLADREDKHLFLREEVERAAFDAGFERVETVPYGSSVVGKSLESYLPQLDLSDLFLQKVMDIFDLYYKKYFDILAHEDAVPAYVFFFQKRSRLISSIFKYA